MPANTYHRVRGEAPAQPERCPVQRRVEPAGRGLPPRPVPDRRRARPAAPGALCRAISVPRRHPDGGHPRGVHRPRHVASINVQDPAFLLSTEAAEGARLADFDPVAVMSNRPEPDHGRIRVFTREGFSNRRLNLLERCVVTTSHELIDPLLKVEQPASSSPRRRVPAARRDRVPLARLPRADDELLKAWCGDRKTFAWGMPSPERQRAIAEHMVAYWRYCREFTAQGRRTRRRLHVRAARRPPRSSRLQLSYREVESIVYGLSFAGHDPVTALIGNSLLCLLTRRDQWDELCDDPSRSRTRSRRPCATSRARSRGGASRPATAARRRRHPCRTPPTSPLRTASRTCSPSRRRSTSTA